MPRKRGNGDGTIYKMESKGLWAAQLTIGVDANGKPKRKTIYGKRQADVRAKLDALKNELATGSVIEPDHRCQVYLIACRDRPGAKPDRGQHLPAQAGQL